MARILVVDDDATTRAQLQAALEAAGHEVRFARDGLAATRLHARGGYDVIIMDMAMPEMNGYQAIRQIVAADPSARIIAVSGEHSERLEYAVEYGAVSSMAKPVSPKLIQDEVARVARDRGGWTGSRIR